MKVKHIAKYFLTLILITTSLILLAQTLPKKPELSDIRSYNQFNLISINAGMNKQQVIDKMGGIQVIQVYGEYNYGGKYKDIKISNPYSRDMKKDSSGITIEILWYYTDRKTESTAINKYDLTPIVFENNLVVGLGWGFFEDYSKRKQIFISSGNN